MQTFHVLERAHLLGCGKRSLLAAWATEVAQGMGFSAVTCEPAGGRSEGMS